MFTEKNIQDVKCQVRIEDVVGEFVGLKRRGEVLVGCCPFHTESDPSFIVRPDKGLFYCCGCGKGGDAVAFLQEVEHCSKEEALRWLASRYGVALPEMEGGDELYRVNDFAQRFFVDYMMHDEMGRAVGLSYFVGRGLSEEIIERFGLGCCPDEWSTLTDRARKEGFSEEALVQTGLAVKRDNGTLFDRFKGRVTFPIYGLTGRVLGFSCRTLRNDEKMAKYVNSPESPIYDKGSVLYGLFQAKQAIKEKDKCYLVEGNVDVVSMHQSGVENSVASCGTALTDKQVRLMKQLTKRVTVVYDGDKAGVKATMRAAELLFLEGMQVRMVLFPDDDDPDSYARKHGSEALRKYLEENEANYVDYTYRTLGGDLSNDPIRKAETMRSMVKTIACVSDHMERAGYIRQMTFRFHNSEPSLQTELGKVLAEMERKRYEAQRPQPEQLPDDLFLPEEYGHPTPAPQTPTSTEDERQERKIVSLLLNSGHELIEVEHQEGEEPQAYVAVLIVSDLLESELEFDNPIYHTIFQEYVSFIERGELPGQEYFTTYPNAQLRTTAISLLVDTMHVSPKWAEKHVAVQDPSKHLKEDVVYSLLTFKLRKLDRKIKELDRDMHLQRGDDTMLLVAKKMQMLNARKAICDELNCVYN